MIFFQSRTLINLEHRRSCWTLWRSTSTSTILLPEMTSATCQSETTIHCLRHFTLWRIQQPEAPSPEMTASHHLKPRSPPIIPLLAERTSVCCNKSWFAHFPIVTWTRLSSRLKNWIVTRRLKTVTTTSRCWIILRNLIAWSPVSSIPTVCPVFLVSSSLFSLPVSSYSV